MLSEWALVGQLAVGLVFAAAAAAKVRHPIAFAHGLQAYEVMPVWLSLRLGWSIITAEVLVAVTHLTNVFMPDGALLGIALLTTFACAVLINLRRGIAVSCFCFDMGGGDAVSWLTMARLAALLICESFIVWVNSLSIGEIAVSPAVATSALVCAGAGLSTAAWLLAVPRLIDLMRPCVTCSNRSTKVVRI